MKPVLEMVVSSSPAVWSPYATATSAPTPTPASTPSRGSARRGLQAKGASTIVEMAKRTARNAKSGYKREGVLNLDERDAPDRRDAHESE